MAHLVAKQGLNIVLVARNKVKLEAVRRELLEKFPNVQVDVVVFDMATKMGEQPNSLTRIREVCHEITNTRDISLLFHFAGITEVGAYFDLPPALIRDIIEIKCVSYPLMTRFIGETMIKRGKRSGIVHCASVATVVPSIPHYQVGGCTQWFNHFLLKSIGWEYSNSLDCLVLRLGHVSSQMTGYDDPNELGTCTPQQAAEGVLRDLGHEDSTFGHQRHDVLWSWINMVMTYVAPERLQQLFMSNKLQRHKRIIKEKMAREGGTVYNAVYYQ